MTVTAAKDGLQVLYLDFDGVLHPSDVRRYRAPPTIRVEVLGHALFESCDVLERALKPYPEVRIVLSTTWVRVLGFGRARDYLSPDLKARVIGATFHTRYHRQEEFSAQSRFLQIIEDVSRRKPAAWLAIDDDSYGWPDASWGHLAHMPEAIGLSDSVAQALLAQRLQEQFGAIKEKFECRRN